jgi:ribosomal-protein-alanine N-acetyltransferase
MPKDCHKQGFEAGYLTSSALKSSNDSAVESYDQKPNEWLVKASTQSRHVRKSVAGGRSMSMKARLVQPKDRDAITLLCASARYKQPSTWKWAGHLESDSFVVTERDGTMTGTIFAWPDESPVAWVRMAALAARPDTDEWLDLSLPLLFDSLQRIRANTLAWMDHGDWIGPYLKARGFTPLVDVVTLVKFDLEWPDTNLVDIHLCPAVGENVSAIVAIDRAAFTPYWWQSEKTLYRRLGTASHFEVAKLGKDVIGYAEGEIHLPTAHLCRIAVHPNHQGRGVGAALLRNALHAFRQQGVEYVTLNTQSDNLFSQKLYRRFGFNRTGDFATVWKLPL